MMTSDVAILKMITIMITVKVTITKPQTEKNNQATDIIQIISTTSIHN